MPDLPAFPDGKGLLIDASGPFCSVAIYEDAQLLECRSETADALEAIFSLTRNALASRELDLSDLDYFIYAEGPGSTLGLRLAAMAIRTWLTLSQIKGLPVYGFNSLHLAAFSLNRSEGHAFRRAVCPWKRSAYFAIDLPSINGPSAVYPLKAENADFATTPTCFINLGRPVKSPLPTEKTFDVDPELAYKELLHEPALLHPLAVVEPFSIETPVFQKWSAERHRASR